MPAIQPFHRFALHRLAQPQVDGHGDAAEVRRHVRHELHRHPQVRGHLALVDVVGQRVRHEVVAQQPGVVAVRGRGARARIAGDSEALRRARQLVEQRRDGDLHGGCVAAGVGNARGPADRAAAALGQAVGPLRVEAVVRRQVDDDRARRLRLERLHERPALVVGQRQHHRVCALSGDRVRAVVPVAQAPGIAVDVRGHRLAIQLARGYERQLQPRVGVHQPDQLRPGMPARPDDADRLLHHCVHCFASSSVAGRCMVCCTQTRITSKSSSPYQNVRHGPCRKQPSDSPW